MYLLSLPVYPPIVDGMPGPVGPGAPGATGTTTWQALPSFAATTVQFSSTRNPNSVPESGNNLPEQSAEPRFNFPETWLWTEDSVE